MEKGIFEEYYFKLNELNLNIVSEERTRPWGGFFVIEEAQSQKFADYFFSGLSIESLKISGKLSPKLLFIKPNSRLSWQYHNRRAEIWKVIFGKIGIIRSFDDTQGEIETFDLNQQITLKQGERHRIIGLDEWAVVAEIWQHTEVNLPSNEDDIIRVQDDYGRN
jgi:mannose-6-phosphate isomerase-like protein (cupin superfamily)